MYWVLYILSSLLVSFFLVKNIKKGKNEFSFFLFVLMATPATVEIGSSTLAPSLFIFFFDLILESNFSFRALRPLVLTLPATILILFVFSSIKKRFY